MLSYGSSGGDSELGRVVDFSLYAGYDAIYVLVAGYDACVV